jgi:hypothetical protein
MVRRAQAPKRWGIVPNYLLLGRRCHEDVIPSMPLARQLAYKLLVDPDNFDLAAVNEIHPGAPVLMSQVVYHLQLIL